MATVPSTVAQAALEYAERGWKVVRLHRPIDSGAACSCTKGAECPERNRGKHPDVGLKWETKATADVDTVEAWWREKPHANVGVLLGPDSGIVDVEFDTPEGRATADRLFGECYTPTFTSGRSTHRLFRWRDDLPHQAKTDIEGLEIRGPGGQSVFPPSVHYSGAQYQWVPGLSPDDVEVQPVPDELMTLLWNHDGHAATVNGEAKPQEHWDRILNGSGEGSRNSDMASLAGKLLRSLGDLGDQSAIEVAWQMIRGQNDRNSPPLDDKELRTTFKSILRKEQERRATDTVSQIVRPSVDDAVAGEPDEQKTPPPPSWHLVRIEADPPVFDLYAPQFRGTARGCIRLTTEQLLNPHQIRVEAARQANAALPTAFSKAWNGSGKIQKDGTFDEGLYSILMRCAEKQAALPEERRDSTIASYLLDRFEKAVPLKDDEQPSKRRITKLPDGSVVFLFDRVYQDLSRSAEKFKPGEISDVLKRSGVGWYQPRSLRGTKLKKASVEALRRLSDIATIGLIDDDPEPD